MSIQTKTARRKPQADSSTIWPFFGLLFALTLVAYWNSFGVPFLFDDSITIQENGALRFGEFSWDLMSPRAILYLTFTLNYAWNQQEVWGYHLINFLLHALNGLFVFTLAERVYRVIDGSQQRARMFAAFAAAFFLVHPVQTESVTYISSRSELLSTAFYLAALWLFASWRDRRAGFLCSLAVAVPFFLGLGSKETVISLPAVLFLYDFLFWSGAQFRPMLARWRFYLTIVLSGTAAAYYILTVSQRRTLGAALPGNLPVWQYFLTELRVIVKYVQLVFLPVGLNLDYDFRPSASLFEPTVLASIVLLTGIVVLGWTLRRRAPVFAFSIFWVFLTLAPTSSFVPIRDVIFEHRLYLPLAGACLSFPLLVELIFEKLRRRLALSGSALRYAVLIVIALIVGTVLRNNIWNDKARLFADVLAKSPGKARPYNLLAGAYVERGEPARAIETLESGLQRMPEKVTEFSDNLGSLYLQTGRLDDAIALYERTVPHLNGSPLALAYNNIGSARFYKWTDLKTRGQLDSEQLNAAVEAFSHALKLDPEMLWTLDSYINASYYRDKGSELEATARQKLNQKPDFQNLYIVGKVAFNNGDYAKADEHFEQAEKLKSNEKIVFFNHGVALASLGQEDRAIEKYLRAIRLDPVFTEAYSNIGLIYMGRRDLNRAFEMFAEVVRQDPRHLTANLNLGSIYMSRGERVPARRHLQTVLEVSPGDQNAAAMLRQLGG